jgi:hypothetical protein
MNPWPMSATFSLESGSLDMMSFPQLQRSYEGYKPIVNSLQGAGESFFER